MPWYYFVLLYLSILGFVVAFAFLVQALWKKYRSRMKK